MLSEEDRAGKMHKNLVKFGRSVFELRERTDRQTDRQTNTQKQTNSLQYWR